MEPLFIYCCHIYEGTSKSNLCRLQTLQNNVLMAVMKVGNRFSATELHNTLEVDWLDVLGKRFVSCKVYKLIQSIGLPNLVNLFKEIQPMRNLRSNQPIKLKFPQTRTFFAQHNFVYRGVSSWSCLSPEI